MAQPDPDDCRVSSTVLKDNHIIQFTATDGERTQTGAIDLDSIFGNVNGALSLGGTNFSAKGRNVQLTDNGTNLDVDLPDDNGDYSTSSLTIQTNINTVNDKIALLFALGAPHSVAHAEADTVKLADTQLLDQIDTVGKSPPVTQLVTLDLDASYDMTNPNKKWIASNLGPQGIGAVVRVGMEAAVVIGGSMMPQPKSGGGGCTIL